MTATHRALILGSVVAAAILGAAPTVTAQVISVTAASPSMAAQGTLNLNVTISGKNFKADAKVTFYRAGTTDTGGVEVVRTTYKRSSQLIATINVPETAAVGSYDVLVKTGGNQATGLALFRVALKAIDPCTSALPTATVGDIDGSPGSRDADFGTGGVVVGPKFMEVAAVAIQHAGAEERIVAVGRSRDKCAGGNWEWTIVRYRASGELDTSFGSDGVVTKTFARGEVILYAVAIDQAGRIVIGGYRHASTSDNYGVVARYTVDGHLDTTFAPDGVEPGIRSLSLERYMTEARAIAIQPDGKIVIAGTDGGTMAIFRLTDAGNFDVGGFNARAVKPQLPGRYVYVDAPSWAYAVALQGDGIVVAGRRGVMRDDDTWDHDGAVWRFTKDGLPDSGFGASGVVTTGFDHTYDVFQAMAVDGSGKIVVTGSKNEGPISSDPVSAVVARYEADGSIDSGFNGGAIAEVRQAGWSAHYPYAIAVTSQDDILVGGSASKRDAGGYPTSQGAGLWRFTSSGVLDIAFWPDGWIVDTLLMDGQYAAWYGLAMQENGKVIAAGRSTWGAYYPVLIRFWQ
jgi:uncharacterized delta-60 repeat protein